jgi:hypothetical protein
MPAPTVSTATDRAELRSRLLVAQFWVGIALAPIAALLLIFGGTTAAAVLAIIAVVVLALSVMLRSDPTSVSASAAGPRDVTVDDMNALRDDVRADITTAARATHRALSEKMARLEESVAGVHRLEESLIGMRRLEESIAGVQRQVEAARAVAIEARDAVDNRRELPLPPPRRPAAVVGSPGVVRHTETVVTRSMYVDRPPDEVDPVRPSGSTVYGSASRASRSAVRVPEPSRDIPEVRPRPGDESPPRARERREASVDRHESNDRYAGNDSYANNERYAGNDSYASTEREDTDHREESWTEQRLRAYLPRSRESLERISGRVVGEPTDSSGDVANDARWSQMRDGDRWAEVRADDRGRELRMAERREERHVDETGTQLRIVDRWSSVREERIPPGDRGPDRETRAQRRRRTEHDDSAATYSVEAAQPALPRPRSGSDGGRTDPPDDAVRGWRDVRSGVVEPGHVNGQDHANGYDAASGELPAYDPRSHDDIGIYRRSSDSGVRRRDSGEFAPARGRDARDSVDFPDQRGAEPAASEDRDDHWVREPGRHSTGRRPQLDFEATDDRWH